MEYNKTVKGKSLSVEGGVFFCGGAELRSSPRSSRQEETVSCPAIDLSGGDPVGVWGKYVDANSRAVVASGKFARAITLQTTGSMSRDDLVGCLNYAVRSPFQELELRASFDEVLSIYDTSAMKYIDRFVFANRDYQYGAVEMFQRLCKKSHAINDGGTPGNVWQIVDELFASRDKFFASVNLLPEEKYADDPVFWLRYAERVLFHVYGGQRLSYRCFDGIVDVATRMYYRDPVRADDTTFWRRYADTESQFDAAFWMYSEINEDVPTIDAARLGRN